MANLIADILDVFAAAIHRPADHPAEELHSLAGKLRDAGTSSETESVSASELHPDPDTPAPVFPAAPEPFGTETAPEGASFPAPPSDD